MELIKNSENKYNEDINFIVNYLNKIIIYLFLFLLSLLIFLNINYFPKNVVDKNKIRFYINYINDCKNHKRYNRKKIMNEIV